MNSLDLVVADGQPVRWALNRLYHERLERRVRGTDLIRTVLTRAEEARLGVYFHGSCEATLVRLKEHLAKQWPKLKVAGMQPSAFRVTQ